MFEDDYSPFDDRHPWERVTDDASMRRRRIEVARHMRSTWDELSSIGVANSNAIVPKMEPFPILQEQYINKDSFNEYLFRIWQKYEMTAGDWIVVVEESLDIENNLFDTTPGYTEDRPFRGTFSEYRASVGGGGLTTLLAAATCTRFPSQFFGGRGYFDAMSSHDSTDPEDEFYGWLPFVAEVTVRHKKANTDLYGNPLGDFNGDWYAYSKDIWRGQFGDMNDGEALGSGTAGDDWSIPVVEDEELTPSHTQVIEVMPYLQSGVGAVSMAFLGHYDHTGDGDIPTFPYLGSTWLWFGVFFEVLSVDLWWWGLFKGATLDIPRLILNNFSTLDMDSVDRWLEKIHHSIERNLR